MVGRHAAHHAVAALGAGIALGVDPAELADALAACQVLDRCRTVRRFTADGQHHVSFTTSTGRMAWWVKGVADDIRGR